MLVKEVMNRLDTCAGPDTCVKDIAAKMRATGVDCVPIVEAGKLVGAVTDHDIAFEAVADGLDPVHTTAQSVMSKSVPQCFEDLDLRDAQRYLGGLPIRSMVVVNRSNEAVGILAADDISRQASRQLPAEMTVEAFSDWYGWS